MKLSRVGLGALFAAGITGCAVERSMMSRLEPGPDGTFTFQARANIAHPLDEFGEQERVRWLERWLSDSGLCPAGYQITGRDVVKSGLAYSDVYYRGRCT